MCNNDITVVIVKLCVMMIMNMNIGLDVKNVMYGFMEIVWVLHLIMNQTNITVPVV